MLGLVYLSKKCTLSAHVKLKYCDCFVCLTSVSERLSVLFSPLPALYVVGGELGEQ